MSNNLIIREVSIDDISGIMRLNNELYDYNWNRNFYLWQYVKSIFPTTVMAALANGEVVGTFGVQKRQLMNNVYLGQIIGINIANKWRGQGLFSMLAEKVISNCEGLDLLCVFSNKNAVGACEKVLGMKFIGEMDRLTLQNNTLKKRDCSYVCQQIDNSVCFNSHVRQQESFMFEHSNDFRKWRFAQSPVYIYYRVKVPSGEYAIIKLFQDNLQHWCCGDIVDFECELNDTDKLRELFLAAILELQNKGVSNITTWANPYSPLRKLLDSLGFTESGHKTCFGVTISNHCYDCLYDFKQWHLVQSDATNY